MCRNIKEFSKFTTFIDKYCYFCYFSLPVYPYLYCRSIRCVYACTRSLEARSGLREAFFSHMSTFVSATCAAPSTCSHAGRQYGQVGGQGAGGGVQWAHRCLVQGNSVWEANSPVYTVLEANTLSWRLIHCPGG